MAQVAGPVPVVSPIEVEMDAQLIISEVASMLAGALRNGVLLALASLGLSLWTLFQQHLKPFSLVGTAGAISIMPNNPGGPSNSAFLYVPILLRNLGARSGRISDLVVQVARRRDVAVCEPIALFDYSKWLSAAIQKKPPAESMAGVFVPPIIGGRDSQLLHVIFTCDEMTKVLAWLSDGGVSFRVLARIEEEQRYRRLVDRTEDAAHPKIQAEVQGGQAVSMLDPSNNALRRNLASSTN